jgi:hypothetical protein
MKGLIKALQIKNVQNNKNKQENNFYKKVNSKFSFSVLYSCSFQSLFFAVASRSLRNI